MIGKEHIAGFLFVVSVGIHFITWIFIAIQVMISIVGFFINAQDVEPNNKETYAWVLFGTAIVILQSMQFLKEKEYSNHTNQ